MDESTDRTCDARPIVVGIHVAPTIAMDVLVSFRPAVRALRRQPILSATIALTLAIGIGATTIVFSLHRSLIEDALPFRDPHTLLALSETVTRDGIETRAFSFPDFGDYRARQTALRDLAAFDTQALSISMPDRAVTRVLGERISDGYFATLGVEAIAGRVIEGERDVDTVVIGATLANRFFGTVASAVGATLTLNDRPHLVAGVMPTTFRGASDQAELWFPMTTGDPGALERRQSRFLSAIGRLDTEHDVAGVRAEMATLFDALAAAHPGTNEGYSATATPLGASMLGELRAMVSVLLACVAFVMLTVCLNLSNLLIARAVTRGHEDALRAALGAGRIELMLHAAAEVALLVGMGGIGALLVGQWGIEILRWLVPVAIPTFVNIQIDAATLGFTLVVTLAAGAALVAMLSLAQAARPVAGALRTLRGGTEGRSSRRLRSGLAAAQIALALTLTIGAGLLARSLWGMGSIDLGFDPEALSTFRIEQPQQRDPQAAVQYARALVQRIETVPGVRGVTLASDLPFDGATNATIITPEGRAPDPNALYGGGVRVYHHRVDARFFRTVAIPILEGRGFLASEIGGESASVVVSQRLAETMWPGRSAIGQRLRGGVPRAEARAGGWLTVVGIAKNARHRTLVDQSGTPRDPDLYLPLAAGTFGRLAVAIRGTSASVPSAAALLAVTEGLDAQVPIFAASDMESLLDRRTGRARFLATMMSAFASVALLLASIGIYGTVAFAVARRTRELGIRLAIGASRGAVFRLLLGDGLRLVVTGGAAGTLAALGMSRWLRGHLVAASPADPIAFVAAIAIVAVIAGVASALPARRASRLDPARILRAS